MRKDVVISWSMGGVPQASRKEFNNPTVFITLPTPPGQKYADQAYNLGWPHPIKGIIRKYAPGVEPNRIALLGFSESCQGPRAMLRSRDAGLINTIVAVDGIHAQYDPSGKPSDAMMAPWYAYASLATGRTNPASENLVTGQRYLVITHSSIQPPGYASTSETAAAIMRKAIGGPTLPGPCPFLDFEPGFDESPPYVAPAGKLPGGVSFPRTVYEHPPLKYSVCEAGLAVFGYENLDPTGVGDHKYQAARILPRAVEQLLAWRWNDAPILSASGSVIAMSADPGSGVVVSPELWEQDVDQSIPWQEYADGGGNDGDPGGGGDIVPVADDDDVESSQTPSAGGMVLSVALGGALGFGVAYAARRFMRSGA